MSHWYEVFDNEDVQFLTRRRAATLLALTMTLAGLTAMLLATTRAGAVSPWLAGGLITSSWLTLAVVAVRRLQRLRRVVWCIKLSDRHLVGYDYTRRKTCLEWSCVQRLELTRKGLLIIGADARHLEIPHLFPEYATLSHRIVHYAERYEVPVLVDGKPWTELDVYALFPFLETNVSGEGPAAV